MGWSGSDVVFWGGLAICGLSILGALGQIVDPEGARARKAQNETAAASTRDSHGGRGSAMAVGPAPEGEVVVVAQKIIRENFDSSDCPLVTIAQRYGDGSIKAFCTNGETYRIFSLSTIGPVAMKCSATTRLGIKGC